MRKLVLLFFTCALISGCSKAKPDNSVLTIGLFGDFNGKYNIHPSEMRNAVQLAVDNQNAKGGIGGKKIRLLLEDVSDIRECGKAIDRFIYAKCDALICVGGSDLALSSTLKTEMNRIPMLCPALSIKALPGKGDFTIPVIPAKDIISSAAAEYILNKIHSRKGSIFYIREDNSVSLLVTFQNAMESPQKKGCTYFTVNRNEKDFAPFASEVYNSKPQFVYSILGGEYVIPLLKSLKQANVTAPVLSSFDLSDPKYIGESALFPDNTLFIKFADTTDLTDQFRKEYAAKFKTEPDIFASSAYDSFLLIMSAYDKTTSGGKISSDSLELRKNIVQSKKFSGASGIISFSKNGAAFRNVDVLAVRKGTIHKVASYGYNEKDILAEIK